MAIGTVENSIVTFNDYPPFTACFQYILLGIKNAYSEDLIITAQNILYLSMIIPICQKVNFKKNLRNLIAIIPAILILPLIFYEDFYTYILVDGFLGVLFALGLFTIYKKDLNKKYKYTFFSAILIALSLTKTTGVLLALMLCVFCFFKSKKEWKLLLVSMILPIIFTSIWYIHVSSATKEWDFNNEFYKNEIIDVENTVKNYVTAFFIEDEITAKNYSVLIVTMLLIVYSIYAYKKISDKRNYKYMLIMISISFVSFLLGLLWVYLNLFSNEETTLLACYDRYISTFLLAWTIFNTFAILSSKKINFTYIYVCIVLLITFAPLETIYTKYIQHSQYIRTMYVKRNYYTRIKKYKDKFSDNDKVFFLSNSRVDNIYIYRLCKYEMMGINIANQDPEYVTSEDIFKNTLIEEGYTYLYIYKITDDLLEKYANIFANIKVEENSLYEIKLDENKELQLERINI